MFRTLTPTLSLIVAILIFVYFVRPAYDEVIQMKAQIVEYNDTTQQYSSFNDRVNALVAKKDGVSAFDQERLLKFLPDVIDIPRLLLDIEALVKGNGMIFGNVTINEKQSPRGLESTGARGTQTATGQLEVADITFTVIGTYRQFKDLLTEIERSLTLFEITSLTLGGGGGDSARQSYTITVRTYAFTQ